MVTLRVRPTRSTLCVAGLALAQAVLAAGLLSWLNWRQASLRAAQAAVVFGLPDRRFEPPRVGSHLPALLVRTEAGPLKDAFAAQQTVLVALIGSCESCASDVVDDCELLWRSGVNIIVVSQSHPAVIAWTAHVMRWRTPIYSEAQLPDGPAIWRDCWRPWILAVNRGRLVATQGSEERWWDALLRIGAAASRRPNASSAS